MFGKAAADDRLPGCFGLANILGAMAFVLLLFGHPHFSPASARAACFPIALGLDQRTARTPEKRQIRDRRTLMGFDVRKPAALRFRIESGDFMGGAACSPSSAAWRGGALRRCGFPRQGLADTRRGRALGANTPPEPMPARMRVAKQQRERSRHRAQDIGEAKQHQADDHQPRLARTCRRWRQARAG